MGAEDYVGTFSSFAGCDIEASFSGQKITSIQGFSVVISREKAAAYTFGSADPRNFSRGKRGIAGSLVFGNFDRNAFLFGMMHGFKQSVPYSTGGYFGWVNEHARSYVNQPQARLDTLSNYIAKFWFAANYSDQVLPFDLTVTAMNEYGRAAYLSIRSVEIMNEAVGFSTDDVLNSQQNTYIARHYIPWQPVLLTFKGEPVFLDPSSVQGTLVDPVQSAVEDVATLVEAAETIREATGIFDTVTDVLGL